MARYTKSADGSYHIHGKRFMILIGTRAQVWHGTAYKTSGGLKKGHLMQNKSGRIVSEKKHQTAKRENRLLKHGYGTKKGKFGWVKTNSKKHRSKKHHSKKHRKSMRGGMNSSNNSHSSSASTDSTSTTDNSANMQKMMLAKMQSGQDTTSNTSMKGGAAPIVVGRFTAPLSEQSKASYASLEERVAKSKANDALRIQASRKANAERNAAMAAAKAKEQAAEQGLTM